MTWRRTKTPEAAPISQWHRWFAWHPVDAGDFTAWLEVVERKGVEYCGAGDSCVEWEYRLLLPSPFGK